MPKRKLEPLLPLNVGNEASGSTLQSKSKIKRKELKPIISNTSSPQTWNHFLDEPQEVLAILPELQKLDQEGDRHVDSKDYEKGLACYTEALGTQKHPKFFTQRAMCHFGLNEYELAQTDAQTAVNMDANAKACMLLLKVAIIRGETTVANSVILTLRRKHRNVNIDNLEIQFASVRGLLEQIPELQQRKNYTPLLLICEQVLKIAYVNLQIKLIKADTLLQLGELDKAVTAYTEVVRMEPTCDKGHYMRAICFYLMGNLDEAIELLQYAEEKSVQSKLLSSCLTKFLKLTKLKTEAEAAFDTKDYAQAKNKFLECYNLMSESEFESKVIQAKVTYKLSVIEENLTNIDAALIWSEKSFQLNSANVDTVVHRGHLYTLQHFFDKAIRDFQLAKILDPSNKIKYQKRIEGVRLASTKKPSSGHYHVLGINGSANLEAIKMAYKKQALIHHPDKHGNATEEVKKGQEIKFKRIVKAYEVLSDPTKRLEYDKILFRHHRLPCWHFTEDFSV